MPANRSRTLEWRRCLKQVQERQGALEIAVTSPRESDAAEEGPHLVWRVRLVSINDDEIVVEQPSAMGRPIEIGSGVHLVVVFSIGQNRWTFNTIVQGVLSLSSGNGSFKSVEQRVLRLAMPDSVQRCMRRNFERLDVGRTTRASAELMIPSVEVWPLLDPKSVLVAERASELRAQRNDKQSSATQIEPLAADLELPEVGPKFNASLVNLGGGGVGLRIAPDQSQAIARHKLFWMRISLSPDQLEPISATCKLAHTHMESNHEVYAGLAFDFSFNPGHQKYVVDQICNYVAMQQKKQALIQASSTRKVA